MFRSDAAARQVAAQPTPPRAVPEHVGRVLGLVRAFVAYGKKLAGMLQQHADNPHGIPGFVSVAGIFRTGDLTLILDRIAPGLLRAAALEARLDRLAAPGLMDRATWDELLHHIIGYGGSLATLVFKRPAPTGQEGPGVFQGY